MPKKLLRVMAIGAHPDDCDFYTYAITARLVEKGHIVKFLSMTNGNAGHHIMSGEKLAERRFAETQASAKLLGITYDVMDIEDGRLEPSLHNREKLMREIRRFSPDVILTNRPNDYHPDHRYTSTLVQDCAYLLCVPNICADTPAMERNPVILFWQDGFREPNPFRPDLVIPSDNYRELLIEITKCHASQSYEWLPWIDGGRAMEGWQLEKKIEYVSENIRNRPSQISELERAKLTEQYGKEYADNVRFVECLQVSEYGAALSDEVRDAFI